MADSAGGEVGRYEYQPYGEIKSLSGSDISHYKFTGKELDDSTGLYDYAARQYDAGLGRFISPDPLVWTDAGIKAAGGGGLREHLSNPQELNRYSYCLGNPVKYVDPDGQRVLVAERGVAESAYIGGHTAIIMQPDDEAAFRNTARFARNSRFYTNALGRLETSTSAHKVGGKLTKYPQGTFSERSDNPEMRLREVSRPAQYKTDTEFIRAIIKVEDRYQNDLKYDPVASGRDKYNSNSYNAGILKEVGVENYEKYLNFLFYQPGIDKPIPIPPEKKEKNNGK